MANDATKNPHEAVFQTFSDQSDTQAVKARVKHLRKVMRELGVDAYLLPRGDMFRGEYVPKHSERLAWLTGFTGSAGLAVIGPKTAALFVDSRYTLQAPAQTDTGIFEVIEVTQASLPPEIANYVPKDGKLGFDPWVHSPGEVASIRALLADSAELVPVENAIDMIWVDGRQMADPVPIEFLGNNRAGATSAKKIADLRNMMAEENADAVFLSMPDSVNWLFNIRGRDVPHTPFALAFALIQKTGKPQLFIDTTKLDESAHQHIEEIGFIDFSAVPAKLQELGEQSRKVWIDPATSPWAAVEILKTSGAQLIEKRDPVQMPKSRKNDAEIAGMRAAHHVDAVAIAKFLAWFDLEAPKGQLTEIEIVSQLEAFRRHEPSIVDVSFDTISGAGPNGAVIHYRVTETTNRTLNPGEIMLVDSGAQYLMGTTDITRTMATGPATVEQKDRFTRVLRGMIAISCARFPKGTNGAQIDILARQYLWQTGITYNHGTGHGVGAFLSVHEGPVGISPRYSVPFEPGNVISNEPGYYKAGEYGIRIENLLHVIESNDHPDYLEFETLTLAPIDTRLIDKAQMSRTDVDWLNAYHARVFKEIAPELDSDTQQWLKAATAPI